MSAVMDSPDNDGYPQFTDWLRFQNYAIDNGFDSLKFVAFLANGPVFGRWLDAYFGLIQLDGIDGFVTVSQMDEIAPGALCMVQP